MATNHPRPCIGINADFVAGGKFGAAQVRLNAGYVDAVLAAGGLPVIIPPVDKPPELEAYLELVDGILLTGGLDIDPRRYGLPPHPAVQPLSVRREEHDRQLIRYIIDRQVPALAIGLGMQQVNLACGGTLYLHLPEDQPRALPHLDPSGGAHRHSVLLEPSTRIDEIYGGGEIRVNSSHHQAIRQVGGGLRVGARAPDGVIEAVEAVDSGWFCVCVQWHPESETASALDRQLFEGFIQACGKQSPTLQLAA